MVQTELLLFYLFGIRYKNMVAMVTKQDIIIIRPFHNKFIIGRQNVMGFASVCLTLPNLAFLKSRMPFHLFLDRPNLPKAPLTYLQTFLLSLPTLLQTSLRSPRASLLFPNLPRAYPPLLWPSKGLSTNSQLLWGHPKPLNPFPNILKASTPLSLTFKRHRKDSPPFPWSPQGLFTP